MRRFPSLALLLACGVLLPTSDPARAATSAVLVTNDVFVGADADLYTIQNSVGGLERNRAALATPALARGLYLVPNLPPADGSVILGCLAVDGVDTDLCVEYTSADGTTAKGNQGVQVPVPAGAALSVHFRETAGVSSGANVRASFELVELPDLIFADGFEAALPQAGPLGTVGETTRAVLVTGEPFPVAGNDSFTIGGSNGTEDRNRAGMPVAATAAALVLLPNLQPQAGSLVEACLSVNGVDSSLCASYDASDWPQAKIIAGAVPLAPLDAISVRMSEANGVVPAVNVRATLELEVAAGEGAIVVTDEPFLFDGADLYSVGGGSSGAIERNRFAVPRDALVANLTVLPNLQPQAGAVVEACLNVGGVDMAPCVTYTSADWPGAKANTVDTTAVSAGEVISIHFTENNAVNSGANVRASFSLQEPAGSGD